MSVRSIPAKPADCLATLTRSQVAIVRCLAKAGVPLSAKAIVAAGGATSTANVTSYVGSASPVSSSKSAIMPDCARVHEHWDRLWCGLSPKSPHPSLLGMGLVKAEKVLADGLKRKGYAYGLTASGKAVAKLIAKRES